MAVLLDQARAGDAKFYLQFGGQGAPWFKELSKYYADPKFKKFFDAALGSIDEERPRMEGTVALPEGIDARGWLDNPESVPSDEYLSCAAVSIPMIQMTQLAHVENLVQNGFPLADMLEYTVAATGHSQGVIPASLMGLARGGLDYYEAVSMYTKYLLILGVSSQKLFPYFAPTPEEIAASEELGGSAPAPMVAVLGEDHETIQKLVDEVNVELPDDQRIYISLYNSPSNRILSSFRASLVAFHKKHKALIDEKKLRFVYLRTTCPFHCKLMQGISRFIDPELDRVGFKYSGDALKIPVYSFYDGENLQNVGVKLPQRMYVDMVEMPLFWKKSIKPAADDASITHILDFGPGKTSQRLSMDTLKELESELPVLAAAVPKDLKKILG